MNNTHTILEIKDICKHYGQVQVLDNINLSFNNNNIYGLLGRNGAGKTSLLNIISGRIFPDNGTVKFHGKDCFKYPGFISEKCCYMPEKHYFPPRLKIKKILLLAQSAFAGFDLKQALRLCELFSLNIEAQYGQLSRGFQSIFRIVLGLAAKTEITIFDEPVLGLDAAARDIFYSVLIEEFSGNPRLFIISTHFIEESADIFNEAIIIDKGKIIRQAAAEDLLARVFYVSGKSSGVNKFLLGKNVISSRTAGDIKTAVVEGRIASEKAVPGLAFSPLTIRKLFIHLTNDIESAEEQNE